jgi:DNA-binding transcriptional MerR regulator
MTTLPPPEDPAWESIRARYEDTVESVQEIAASIGLSRISLSLKAAKLGWKMRGRAKPKRKKATAKTVVPTTRETIARLKDMLQQRVATLEQELKELGTEVSALNNERGIKSANVLVRTLEKVLELERNDKLKRTKAVRDFKYFDEQQRLELARKIERLEAERDGALAGGHPADRGGGGTEQPVALLGEAGPAASAG